MKAAFFIGRLLFGGFFLQNGINLLKEHESLAPYAGSKGIPNPDQAVLASGMLLLVGGASIILGLKPKLGAASSLAFSRSLRGPCTISGTLAIRARNRTT